MNKKTEAILLINTGSPELPEEKNVKKYLGEFLMDKRVIDIPFLIRWFLVNKIIIPRRVANSTKLYKSIWRNDGSPLIALTEKLAKQIESNTGVTTRIAMRYGSPSITNVMTQLRKNGITKIYAIPMFPHYAMSTYETVVEHFRKVAHSQKFSEYTIAPPYYSDPGFIKALIENAKPYLNKGYDHVLITYHSLPERHLHKSDPGNHCLNTNLCCETPSRSHQTCYKAQGIKTAKLFAEAAKIKISNYSISYQSALPNGKWIGPDTEEVAASLARKGIKNLVVIAPGFVTDNLETLEELSIRLRETFLSAGGKFFTYIPALNTHPQWVEALESLVKKNS